MRYFLPLLLMLCCSGTVSVFAQSTPQDQLSEAIKETLEEKSYRPEHITYAKGASAGYDQRLTNNPTNIMEGEVALAMRPTDSSKLVLSFMKYDAANYPTFPIYYSANGGQSWTASSFDPLALFSADYPTISVTMGGDPMLAWDKTGRVYMSWIYAGEKNTHDSIFYFLYYAWSDNNGQAWTTAPGPAHLIGSGVKNKTSNMLADYTDGLFDREWMAVDNSSGTNAGRLYCAFLLEPPISKMPLFGISVRSKPAASNNFGTITNALPLNMQFANVAVDKVGKVHVIGMDMSTQQLKYTWSANGGSTFASPAVVATGANSGGFSKVRPRENAAPNLAADSTGNLHIVYSTYPATGPAVSYYVRSTNNGTSWGTPVNLNTLFGNLETFMPVICASGNNIAISTTVIDGSDSARYYEVNSTNNGQTWSTPLLLSGKAAYYPGAIGFYGDYNRSVRSQCRVYTGWCDGRDGLGPKIYFARTSYCTPNSVSELTAVNSPVQLQAVYPIPARHVLHLQLTNGAGPSTLVINLSDVAGRSVLSSEQRLGSGKSELVLPLRELKPGYYMLSLKASGITIATRQVLLE